MDIDQLEENIKKDVAALQNEMGLGVTNILIVRHVVSKNVHGENIPGGHDIVTCLNEEVITDVRITMENNTNYLYANKTEDMI